MLLETGCLPSRLCTSCQAQEAPVNVVTSEEPDQRPHVFGQPDRHLKRLWIRRHQKHRTPVYYRMSRMRHHQSVRLSRHSRDGQGTGQRKMETACRSRPRCREHARLDEQRRKIQATMDERAAWANRPSRKSREFETSHPSELKTRVPDNICINDRYSRSRARQLKSGRTKNIPKARFAAGMLKRF